MVDRSRNPNKSQFLIKGHLGARPNVIELEYYPKLGWSGELCTDLDLTYMATPYLIATLRVNDSSSHSLELKCVQISTTQSDHNRWLDGLLRGVTISSRYSPYGHRPASRGSYVLVNPKKINKMCLYIVIKYHSWLPSPWSAEAEGKSRQPKARIAYGLLRSLKMR